MNSKPWRRWDRWDWSGNLLEFHFGRSTGHTAPVDHIHASADALGACAGVSPSEREAVKDHFLSRMSNAAKQHVPWAQCSGDPSTWYAFLVAICTVFADEDLAEENQYLSTISNTLGPNYVRELERLPHAWRALERWLRDRPGSYRPLIVPDPGGWTRIGHAKKLAFPLRSDITALSESAAKLGIGDDPSIADAQLLAERASRLSPGAKEAQNKFTELVASAAPPDAIYDSSWWGAIRTACRASIQRDSSERGEYGLLVFQNEDDAEVIVVLQTSCGPQSAAWSPVEGYEPWTHYCDEPDLVRAALDGAKGFGRVSALARKGIVPLQDSLHWETFPPGSGQPTGFLVRSETFNKIPDGSFTAVPVAGTDWHLVPERVESLYPTGSRRAASRRVTAVGGARVGPSKYLNDAGLLPRIQAPWATDVRVELADGRTVALVHSDHNWLMSLSRTYTGPALIVAENEKARSTLALEFVHSVARAEPRQVGNPQAWMIEGGIGARSLAGDTTPRDICRLGSARSLLLGSVVGSGAESVEEAAWEVVKLGNHNHVNAVGPLVEPSGRSENDGSNRAWRSLLSGNINDPDARTMANRAKNARGLPRIHDVRLVPKPETIGVPDPVAERLENFLAARSNTRAEIPIGELHKYVVAVTGAASRNEPWTRIRELEQAGLIEVATSTSWSKRRVLVRPPLLRVHRNDHSFVGVLEGLSTKAMRDEMMAVAESIGARPYLLDSFSPLTTRAVGINPAEFEQLQEISRKTRVKLAYLSESPIPPVSHLYDLESGLPTTHTPWGAPFEFPFAPNVKTQLFRKEGSPDWYVIDLPGGQLRVRLRSTAEQIAAASDGSLVLERRGPDILCNVSLPLPAARWITGLGAARPGFDHVDHRWKYRLPNTTIAERTVFTLRRWVEDLYNRSTSC